MRRSAFISGSACAAVGLVSRSGSASCVTGADEQRISRFVDDFVTQGMRRYAVPGATISVVLDGSVLCARGYGFADRESKRPVSAAKTLVRAYSVSKTFTATAVMQLVESGKLDLNQDVNSYLRLFKIPRTFPEPITLEHLLTHTAGFVDDETTLLATGTKRSLSLGEWLRDYMAPRKLPVGTKVQYSNYGFSLAGYIVEVVAGLPYAEYMQQFVLDPLKMSTSSFLWPDQLPQMEEEQVASGYTRSSRGGPVIKLSATAGDFANTPAANLLTTAQEMTHFMLAQLGSGAYGGTRILSRSGVRAMQTPHASDAGYGFFWRNIDGHTIRWLFHAGGCDGSISDMELQPQARLGYFFWYNQGGDDDRKLRSELNAAFAARLFDRC